MIDKITITSIGMPRDWLLSRDDLGVRIVKPVLQQLVQFWHDRYLPDHFRIGAELKYGYKKRTPKYLKAKQRQSRRNHFEAYLPLIWSGETKRQVSRTITVTGTNKRATGRMTGPRYIYMYSKGGNHPYLAGEITAVTREEADRLSRLASELMTGRINQMADRHVQRVG